MEQQIITDNNLSEKKIYKDKEVWVGAFIGGPLVAGYQIAKNYKVFRERDKVIKTWFVAIASSIFLFYISIFAPFIDRMPNFIIPLIYTGMAYLLVRIYQGEKIIDFIRSGGKIHSWWKTLGVALLGLAISSGLYLGTFLVVEAIRNANVITKNYGTSKHNISFDKTNVQESEIDAIADGFTKTNLFDNGQPWYIFVQKVENNYEIALSTEKSVLKNPENLEFFIQQRKDLQALFPDNKIVFNLIAETFDNVIKRIE